MSEQHAAGFAAGGAKPAAMDEARMRRCIERKREGEEIAAGDWHAVVAAFMDGRVDDAQMAALCMACVLRGMTFGEAHALTAAMVQSGEVLHFDRSQGPVVDKHSTGGVSDIVSLAAIPLAAACGVKVAKLSGRALGHTGGTIDKLETIPGFRVELSMEQFERNVQRVGCAIAAQTESLVPADKRLYRLRDRTATVPAIGLIASSIASKKVAGGAHAFVFDVKAGAASFVPDPGRARELAQWLVEIASSFGKEATAFVSDMHQPLGRCIGTGVEVIEARDFLRGEGDPRARELVLEISAAMVSVALGDESEYAVRRALEEGRAYAKFAEMIAAQGGDVSAMEAMELGEGTPHVAPVDGFIGAMDVVELGHLGRRLSQSDRLGGLRVAVKIGDKIERGEPLIFAYGRDRKHARGVESAFKITPAPIEAPPLIYERSISATT